MNETLVTIQGRIAADPEIRIGTGSGMPFTTFRVASTARRPKAGHPGQFEDAGTSWYDAVAFRRIGANIAASFKKGQPVIIHGRLRIRDYQRSDQTYGTRAEIDVWSAGHDLTFGVTAYQKGGAGQYPDVDRTSTPEVQAAFDGTAPTYADEGRPTSAPGFGDPERDDYVVEGEPAA